MITLTNFQDYYWFDCKCSACEENFPIREKMSEKVSVVFCPVCRAVMELEGSVWVCHCGANMAASQVNTILSRQVKRTLETARMESSLGVDVGEALRSYCDILGELYRLTSHPWTGLEMPERMLWKAIRTKNGNKHVT